MPLNKQDVLPWEDERMTTPPLKLMTAVADKVDPQKPKSDTLTDGQYAAYSDIIQWLGQVARGQDVSILRTLEGYAGTGKTYTASMIVEAVLFKHHRVLYTAPTNKAVKVAEAMANYKSQYIEYSTLHGALAMQEAYRPDGSVYFKPDPEKDKKIDGNFLVIVDEASMVGEELFAVLEQEIIATGVPVLFIGDSKQLPPVNEPRSIVFDDYHRTAYDIQGNVLAEVVRQKGQSPILDIATHIRNMSPHDEKKLSDIFNDTETEDGSVYFLSLGQADHAQLLSHAIPKAYFCTEAFEENQDFCKVLAWTNKEVDYWNSLIRKLRYDTAVLPKIMKGEYLIANRPIHKVGKRYNPATGSYGNRDERIGTIFQTNEEFIVDKFEVKTKHIFRRNIKVYSCTVNYKDVEGKSQQQLIDILHEDDEELYQSLKKEYYEHCIADKKARKKPNWYIYYLEQSKLADVKYNYALTVHKSQGSTFQNVLVCDYNFSNMKKKHERQNLRYTAVTRASDRLLIIEE